MKTVFQAPETIYITFKVICPMKESSVQTKGARTDYTTQQFLTETHKHVTWTDLKHILKVNNKVYFIVYQ